MINLIKNIFLVLIAFIIAFGLFPIGFIFGIFYIIFTFNNKEGLEYSNKLFRTIAISIDQSGNVICQHLFNFCLIRNDGYKFGNADETISFVIGKNIKLDTLTIIGKVINFILNLIEKDHAIKALD